MCVCVHVCVCIEERGEEGQKGGEGEEEEIIYQGN
jgi:hypothetical protein